MTIYVIENTHSAVVLGAFDARTPDEALEKLAADAGYDSVDAMDDAAPSEPGEISVTAIDTDRLRGTNLGFGDWDDVVEKLPPGTWTLILDDAADNVSSPYTYTDLSHDVAVAVFAALGGTVTRSETVTRS